MPALVILGSRPWVWNNNQPDCLYPESFGLTAVDNFLAKLADNFAGEFVGSSADSFAEESADSFVEALAGSFVEESVDIKIKALNIINYFIKFWSIFIIENN